MKRFFCVPALLLCALLTRTGHAASSPDEFARGVVVYRYRPEVFTDQKIQVGLSETNPVLASMLWYIRMDESARTLFGMENLASLVQADRIPGLDFSGHRRLIDSDLEQLFQQDLWSSGSAGYKFRLLKLAATAVSNRALSTIGRLVDLDVLELNARITNEGMVHLQPLHNLKVLSVESSGVTDRSVDTVSRLAKLQRLDLKSTGITDAGLRKLATLHLRQIDLGPRITDQGLQTLRGMKTLEQLDVSQSRITQRGLAGLAATLRIHTLFLGASFSDADLAALAPFKNLKRLDLTGAPIMDAGARFLGSFPQVEELALTRTRVTDSALDTLSRLPKLRYLEVSETSVTPEGLQRVSGFSSLQVLAFSTRRRLTMEDVRALVKFQELHTLIINHVPLGRAMIEYLRRQPRSGREWLDGFIPWAEAAEATDADVQETLNVANLPSNQTPHPFEGIQGLKSIHETESSLDEVVPAAAPSVKDPFEENEKNFMGEFTVNSVSPKKHKATISQEKE